MTGACDFGGDHCRRWPRPARTAQRSAPISSGSAPQLNYLGDRQSKVVFTNPIDQSTRVSVIVVSDHTAGAAKGWDDIRTAVAALAQQDFGEFTEFLLVESEHFSLLAAVYPLSSRKLSAGGFRCWPRAIPRAASRSTRIPQSCCERPPKSGSIFSTPTPRGYWAAFHPRHD
jgi:hypothetical protein